MTRRGEDLGELGWGQVGCDQELEPTGYHRREVIQGPLRFWRGVIDL